LGDEKLTNLIDDILDKEETETGGEKEKVEKKEKRISQTIKEQSPLKNIVDMLNSGQLQMDIPLVVKFDKKFAIKVIDTAEEIAIGKIRCSWI
jgi:uncharacterized protein YheU (UPF0270 family)